MYWNSFSDFIQMGNHGFYVWGAFGMTALVMLVETWITLKQSRTIRQQLVRQIKVAALEAAQPQATQETA